MTVGYLMKIDGQLLSKNIDGQYFWNDPMSYCGTVWYVLVILAVEEQILPFLKYKLSVPSYNISTTPFMRKSLKHCQIYRIKKCAFLAYSSWLC